MRSQLLTGLLAAIVAASPVPLEEAGGNVVKRQIGLGSTSNELESGSCRPVTFIMARGSTEPGNMGASVGPALCDDLKKEFGEDGVACQGVGGAYIADLGSNALPQGTTSAAVREAQGLMEEAASKCPDTKIVTSGYSQGAALIAAAVSESEVQDRIVGTVLFGYTKNLQNSGGIPDYPEDQTLVICMPGDGVCTGTLLVTPAHLTYVPTVPKAAEFLSEKIDGVSSDSSSSSGGGLLGSGSSDGLFGGFSFFGSDSK